MNKHLAVAALAFALLFLFSGSAMADTEYKGRNQMVAWDASMLETGEACVDCRYEVWIKNIVTGAEIQIGETPELSLGIILPKEGKFRVGGLAKRTVDGDTTQSPKVWSDAPEVCLNGETFFLRWTAAPLGWKHLRKAP